MLQGSEQRDRSIQLPDWTRVVWHDVAADVWKPRLQRIAQAWSAIELESALQGLRPSALLGIAPENLPALYARVAPAGRIVVVLQQQGAVTGYAKSAAGVTQNQPWEYRVAVCEPFLADRWLTAWQQQDNEAIGALLGFPACCQTFFEQTWQREGRRDPTWAAACATESGVLAETERQLLRTVPTSGVTNILWRWMGVRAVTHMPCRFDCEPSRDLGEQFLALGDRLGFGTEVAWIRDILAWPVEWNAVHGIAEIKTPICKVSTQTDFTLRNTVVRHAGSAYPAEGVNGLSFPYEKSTVIPLTSLRSYRAAFTPKPEDTWTGNGFTSLAAMQEAHDAVVRVVDMAASMTPGRKLLDLGCGTGELLRRCRAHLPDLQLSGIDTDAARVETARQRDALGSYSTENLFDCRWAVWPDVVLFMPGRLLEDRSEEDRSRVVSTLELSPYVVAYAYGDWLTRFGSMSGLLSAARLSKYRVFTTDLPSVGVALLKMQVH